MAGFGAEVPRSFNLACIATMVRKETEMTKKTFKIGRSAKTGQFKTIKRATERKSTHVVETIKKPK